MMPPAWGCDDKEMGYEEAPNMMLCCHVVGIQEVVNLDLLEKDSRYKSITNTNTEYKLIYRLRNKCGII